MTVEDFLDQLETGLILCEHANKVHCFILEKLITAVSPQAFLQQFARHGLRLKPEDAAAVAAAARESGTMQLNSFTGHTTFLRR